MQLELSLRKLGGELCGPGLQLRYLRSQVLRRGLRYPALGTSSRELAILTASLYWHQLSHHSVFSLACSLLPVERVVAGGVRLPMAISQLNHFDKIREV